ncbi:hypothetical protein [Bythopirellula goksoeyrii]|uniref:Uncharacterized protein n=1 Tax=Bythopirellula goksoeyrii TaxID=1400387 RepID=A0A5B9QTZ7_9BACT|nr:hypothetical protein [Bythopirellula goksoeyrii]QEG37541.1 hypothetical protein Pr1d_48870 [Bythopirellula goksoeyrii]
MARPKRATRSGAKDWIRPQLIEIRASSILKSGGILMKNILVCVAMLTLATTGCAGNRMLGGGCCGQPCNVSTSQNAPRPQVRSNLYGAQQCSYDGCCDAGCGCSDVCCDPACGCDVCCDPACGCDTCCEPSCSGCDPYGNGCCNGGGCQLGGGRCGIGNGGMCNGGMCNGGAGGRMCGACGGRGCGACGGCGIVGAIASGFCPHAGGYPEQPNFNPGPPVGQTAYPYYTVRGPRDFLQNNPPSIGPY